MIQHFLQKIQNWFARTIARIFFRGANLELADKLIAAGDFPGAIVEIHQYLKRDPHNCRVVLALANCYDQSGDKHLFSHYAEVAYRLDDTYVVSIFHWARALIDRNQCAQALPLLGLLKDNTVFAEGANTQLSAICMNLGDAYKAKEFQLTAWFSDFDDLRAANCYLFRLAYNDSGELLLAQEHQFWGETLKPISVPLSNANKGSDKHKDQYPVGRAVKPKGARVRIGYWGSDFHEHSVRYFSRPLLENHDVERFEVFIYDDNPTPHPTDRQAMAFKAITADYFEVAKLKDAELTALFLSHDLDILVDITGHTSSNRLRLMQQRLAKVQITGLAYPPTTGLRSIDFKMLDPHIWTDQADLYYAESPLVLPESFWCFDPKEDVPYSPNPPVLKNGYVTFGCFGNVAKITPSVLSCWNAILERLPDSRLIIQSPLLVDVTTTAAFRKRLAEAGVNDAQVELRGPTYGEAFWRAYQDVDAILDTFPFNGGTTSCFATYVGVPVITWSGQSLISRMGRSIMFNLGYPDFVAETAQDYMECALAVAKDTDLLCSFRKEAPGRFKISSLGNGKKFAKEFEAVCEQLLDRLRGGALENHSRVPPLPPEVMLHRAQMVWYNGNFEAANRIVEVCLRHYPECGGAHLFKARQYLSEYKHKEAAEALEHHLADFSLEQVLDAKLLLARIKLIQDDLDGAVQVLGQSTLPEDGISPGHVLQLELLRACTEPGEQTSGDRYFESFGQQVIRVLVPCEEAQMLADIEHHARANCIHPDGWSISYERCGLNERIEAYNEVIESEQHGILVIMQRNLRVFNPHFFLDVVDALQDCELLGCAGALSWRQKDWSQDLPEYKAWGLFRISQHAKELFDLQFAGTDRRKIVTDAVVLDGKFLAFRPASMRTIAFDEDLSDSQSLAEEDWSNRVHAAGQRVHIHRNLGLLISESLVSYPAHCTQGQRRLLERLQLDPLALTTRDYTSISVPVKTVREGVEIAGRFLTE